MQYYSASLAASFMGISETEGDGVFEASSKAKVSEANIIKSRRRDPVEKKHGNGCMVEREDSYTDALCTMKKVSICTQDSNSPITSPK